MDINKELRKRVWDYIIDNELSYSIAAKRMKVSMSVLKTFLSGSVLTSIKILSRIGNFLDKYDKERKK